MKMHPLRYLLLIGAFVVQNNVQTVSAFPMIQAEANRLIQKTSKLHSNSKLNFLSVRGGANDKSDNSFFESIDTQSTTSLLVVGELLPKFRSFLRGSTGSYNNGWMELCKVFHLFDVGFIAFFALVFEPLFRLLYKALFEKHRSKKYDGSTVSKGVEVVSEAGWIAAFLYLVELFFVYYAGITQHDRLDIGDVDIRFSQIPKIFATTIYGLWGATKLTVFISQLISDYVSNPKNFPVGSRFRDRQSLAPLYQRFTTAVIYSTVTYGILDACNIGATKILKSFIALGGLSSLVIGLALKEPASQLLSGVLILLMDRFRSGEEIELSGGTKGKVINIGWTETLIQSSDNISVHIPNSEIVKQRMSNVSRTPRSQVKMDLRFCHEDMDRVQEITGAIKEEISVSCPKLITDGRRPFRVLWKDINHDHIVVSIDSHYDIPPSTGQYWENRQQVLLAISRSLKRLGVKLALPVEVSIYRK